MKEEKKVIVEFIEDGTDKVISTYSLEEYNNMIESVNNLIPKEYKFIKTEMIVSEEDMDIIKKHLIK